MICVSLLCFGREKYVVIKVEVYFKEFWGFRYWFLFFKLEVGWLVV